MPNHTGQYVVVESTNTQIAQTQLRLHYQFLRDQKMKLPEFRDTGFRVFSENDEDGLLLYIFSLIGTTNKQCLDVAYAGPQGANTTNLICNWGWNGLLIESNAQGVETSNRFFAQHKDTYIYPPTVIQAWVTAENINELCERNGLTGEIDFLSLDMDGVDYWILKSLHIVKPRVLIVEYQDIWGPDRAVTVPYKPDFVAPQARVSAGAPVDYCGASLAAFVKLGKEKGYRLVGTNKYGYNAIFLKTGVGENWLPEIDVHSCFSHPKVKWGMKERLPNVKDMPWIDV